MLSSMGPRNSWTARETAFIIGFADYCIHHGWDYQKEVAVELRKFSSRTPASSTVLNKLSRVLKKYGITNVSVLDLRTEGTGRIDFTLIPSDVRAELDGWREEWGFSPLARNGVSPEPSSLEDSETSTVTDGDVGSASAAEQPELQTRPEQQAKTVQVEGMPEPQADISGIDGTADRPTMSPFSPVVDRVTDRIPSPDYEPSPPPPAKRVTGRKRSATPEDTDDDDYHPSPKRNKTARNSSARMSLNVSEDTQGPVVDMEMVREGVAVPKTRSSRTRMPVQTPRESATVITIDNEAEQVQPPREARPVVESGVRFEQQGAATPDQGAIKGRAAAMAETEDMVVAPSPKSQKTGEPTFESVNDKIDACLSILSSVVTHQSSLPEETAQHIHQVIRTFKDPRGSVLENLMTDLTSQRALKARYGDMIKKLIEFIDLGNETIFPKTPPQNEVDRLWAAFHEHIVSIVGSNNVKPTLSLSSVGYMVASAENIAHGRIPNDQLEAYVESLGGFLRSPQAQQLLFSALLCRWVFADPEIMLKDMHSAAMLHLYNGVLSTADTNSAGLARVQQNDQLATKLLFEDPAFQTTEVKKQKGKIQSMFFKTEQKVCAPSKIPGSMKPEKFASELVDLKIKLLLSPKDYRIRYVGPGVNFNASTMRAFDVDNFPVSDAKAAGRKVAVCVFPALTCQDPQAITEGSKIDDVLVKNRRFLPTFQEISTAPPNVQLSKAVVVLQAESDKKQQ
ncbi:hypothetical protein E8E11_009715 [Didymella keratinophila]|nr:hypothetical protein E8E11_009715 [Didymella keratinophila]